MNHEAYLDGCFDMVHVCVCAICLTHQNWQGNNRPEKNMDWIQQSDKLQLLSFCSSSWPDLDENARPKPDLPHYGIIHRLQSDTREAACVTIW